MRFVQITDYFPCHGHEREWAQHLEYKDEHELEMIQEAFSYFLDGQFGVTTSEILAHYDDISCHYPEIAISPIIPPRYPLVHHACRIPVYPDHMITYQIHAPYPPTHIRIGLFNYICSIEYYVVHESAPTSHYPVCPPVTTGSRGGSSYPRKR
jgi:hypothetical protein